MTLVKRRYKLLIIPVLGMLILLGFLTWLLVTPAGLLFVVDKVATIGGINLQHENLQGTIASKISASRISFQNESVDVSLDKLQTGINLFWLLDARLDFKNTDIDSISVTLKDTNNDTRKNSSGVELPIAISFSSLSVNQLLIADAKPMVEINKLSAEKIKLEQEIELDKLQFDIANAMLSVDGSLGFAESSDIDLDAAWKLTASENLPEVSGISHVDGSFKSLSVRTELKKPQAVLLKTEIENIFTDLSWQSTLSSESFDLGLLTPAIKTRLEKVNARLKGDLKSVTVQGASLIVDSDYGNWKTQFHATLNEQQWQLPSLQLESRDSNTSVQIQANSIGKSPYTTDAALEIIANWQQLQWPLTGKANYTSAEGRTLINGTLKNYQITTTGDFAFDDYRFTDIIAEGKGTASTLNFDRVQVNYLNGSWQGSTSLDWSNGFQWKAALDVKGANPSVQWKQLEAQLDGTVTGSGTHQGDNWKINGDIKNLSGSFRSYPVRGSSQFSVSAREYAFRSLKLRSGSNTLAGSIAISDYLGDADTKVDANWKLNAKNLSQLLPDTVGDIVSQGKAQGSLQAPSIDATASTEQLKYQAYSFSKAKLKARANLQHDDRLTISLNAQQGTIGGTSVDQLFLNVDGTTLSHEISANTKLNKDNAIQLRGTGGYKDSQWNGQLTVLDIETTDYGNWKLSEPVALKASNQVLSMSKACIALTNQQALVCNDIDSRGYSSYKVNSKISKLPVSLLRKYMPQSVTEINGTIEGDASLFIDNKLIKTLTLSLESEGGELTHTLINSTPTTVRYRQLNINAAHNKQTITFSSNMDMHDTGSARASLTLANVRSLDDLGVQQSIAGEVVIKIDDLSLLPVFFPDIQSIQGTTSSQFRISGTLGNPKLTGKSTLKADRITLPIAGLELKNTELKAHSSEARKLTFEGSAQSGDGQINIKGEIPDYLAETLMIRLEISGKQFLATKIPDVEMEISPQLSLILEGNTINMEGEVFVDRANITPLETYSGLTPSSDVVFIDPKSQNIQQEPFKLQGSLRLKLSERVYVQTAGFNGRVTGELVITESANNVTLATGELIIKDGRYTAPIEGRDIPSLLLSIAQKELLIDESKLIFASSPIDNPRLDIRARRPTSNDIVVGVDIKGHANNPQIVLFSEPAMDQADVLAYLTLGYPLTEASKNDGQYLARIASSIGLVGGEKLAKNIAKEFGIDEVYIQSEDTTQQAQLVLGKYLSPKLYIRYAVGIGEAVDTLQIQYKLTDRWILRTETAETQKGTDLIYTIDK